MKEVYIISAVRTPIGSFGGSLKDLSATQLGAIAIKGALQKAGVKPEQIQDVLMGCVLQANLGQAPARQAAKFAGLPNEVNCTTINKVCASGMKAIALAAQSILLGDADIVVAGGMESMSNVPFYDPKLRWGNKYGDVTAVDGLAKDGLTDVYDGKAMGNAAELCARECGISREAQDAFAIESYRRSQAAWENGKFNNEIEPVVIPQRKGDPVVFVKDEEPYNVKFDKIPSLNPAFEKGGTVTAANASTMNDGAAALVLMSKNEAFAVVGIENTKRMKLDPSKVNVHGGAVSIGHPLGASGARIIVTLINVLKANNAKYGAAGICNGGGGASAMVIENIN
jgi:acetyl-CoA C-acetyltransferase